MSGELHVLANGPRGDAALTRIMATWESLLYWINLPAHCA
jgi:hypothetical protein